MNEKVISLKLTYDPVTDSSYIYLDEIKEGEIKDTFPCDDLPETIKGDVNLDFSGAGQLKGIEILGASRVLPEGLLK